MMSGLGARMGRPFIESGMRRGTPAPLHHSVVVVWSDVGEWKRRIAVHDTDLAYLVLVDRTGHVLWTGTGGKDAGEYAALAARIRELLPR
jgi:hypothetical protein